MAKKTTRFLALLRGINVGGKNIIAKDDLRACFESLGLSNVRTYIQSGNVLFQSETTSVKNLSAKIESGLSRQFHYNAQAVVFTRKQYAAELQAMPKKWGTDESSKHNALFLIGGLKPAEVVAQLPPPVEEYELVGIGKSAIFWSASKKNLGKTTIMKLARMPIYKQMTVRNHNTTFKLLELLDSS
jgi:uncharacterized protein (DUF1697 family)